MSIADRVRVKSVEVLSDDWYVLKKTTFDFRRTDGSWQRQTRESYDRGNGCTVLLYSLTSRTIVLVKQFRYPAFSNGYDDLLIETPAGLLDSESPEKRIISETREETGIQIKEVKKVFEAFSSPGSVTERLHCFIAEYDPAAPREQGGGLQDEGEDIEVMEVKIEEAARMVETGEIVDAKTIMLIQYAQLHLF